MNIKIATSTVSIFLLFIVSSVLNLGIAQDSDLRPLKLFWSPERGDNFTTATEQGESDALKAGYRYVRTVGLVYARQVGNTVPLKLFWSSERGDNFTTATAIGERQALGAGYRYVRTEGYIAPSATTSTEFSIPLKLYWGAGRGDNFTVGSERGEADALASGYQHVRIEGFIRPGQEITVATYNVFLRPDIADNLDKFPEFVDSVMGTPGLVTSTKIVKLSKDARVPLLAKQIESGGQDIVVLQEVFSDSHRHNLLDALVKTYPHRTRILGRDRFWEQDGGVVILSKFPIDRQFQRLYGTICAGWLSDCKADKGVLYARINVSGKPLHLFGTHLQAGNERPIREKQLQIVSELISSMQIPASQPVLIVGDLNVSLRSSAEFESMLSILDATHPGPTHGQHGQTTAGGNNFLDYVLFSNRHLAPVKANNDVKIVKVDGEFISDHHPVTGRFTFENWLPEPTGTFPFAVFFEGDAGTQDYVCSFAMERDRKLGFTGHHECDNDEVRSVTLYDLPPGRVLRLYDAPDGRREDDWLEIVAKRFVARSTVPVVQSSFQNQDVRVTYHRNNGLSGKVSLAEVAKRPLKTVDLYERENQQQNMVCSVELRESGALSFQDQRECDNDEARSAVLYNARKGQVLRLFDHPFGRMEDDWVQIEVLRDSDKIDINSFERDQITNDVRITYFRNNGFNGKVSSLQFPKSTDLKGIVSFYKKNSAKGNKVCDLGLSKRTLNFTKSKQCDNDRARSMVLTNAPAGASITVYDSPDCKTNDDYATVSVRRNLARERVDSFETNFESAALQVSYYKKNGLDGKVSCVRISVP